MVRTDRYAPYVIDFQNASLVKLQQVDPNSLLSDVQPLLVQDERPVASFKGIRDYVVFTDKRVIAVNVQGMTGKKRDFTSLPYSKIQAFSVETAGRFDLDAELDLWFSGLGKVRFEFRGQVDIRTLSQLIATYTL